MKEDKSRRFKYIQIPNEGKRYFCLQQSLVILAWILYFHHDALSPIDRAVQKSPSFRLLLTRIWKCARLLKRQTKILFVFALYKYQWRSVDRVVELSQYGQLCLPVHQGHKIFDLRRRVTIKVFDPNVHDSVMKGEIELLKRTSQINFAPTMHKWSLAGKWYKEDFLYGSLDSSHESLDSVALLKKFHDEVMQYLNRLVLFQEAATRNAIEYASEIIRRSGLHRLSRRKSTAQDYEVIKIFFDTIISRLMKEGDCSIFLVFTHGDFVPANMVNTPHGMKIIDWENAGSRSALFDFYSYFFYRPVSREVPIPTILSEINCALPIFLTSLSCNSSDISSHTRQFEKIYRWIFYIEILCRLIEREMSDRNLNIMSYVLEYINVFMEFEKLTADDGPLND